MTAVPTHSGQTPGDPSTKKSPIFLTFFIFAAILAIVGVVLVVQRRGESKALAKETEASTVPTVAIIQPLAEAG